MVDKDKARRLPSLRLRGLAHTFTANSFSSFWSQRLSMVQAVHYAESLLAVTWAVSGQSLPPEVAFGVSWPDG